MRKIRGQIWIETVLYTLIGITIIGIVLAIATPKINEAKDRILVEQTLKSLDTWDDKILELLDRGPGNTRNMPKFLMKRGTLTIDGSNDAIVLTIDGLSKPYSEPGYPIREGNVILTSIQGQHDNSVQLVLSYMNVSNITFDGADSVKQFTAASTAYSFSLENRGGTPSQINVIETSRG